MAPPHQHWISTPWYAVTVPGLDDHVVRRPAVVAALEEAASTARVVQIVAPAGFGKTSVAAEWALTTKTPVAWLSLAQLNDGEPALFHAIVAALHGTADAHWSAELDPLLDLRADAPDGALRRRLLADAVGRVHERVALVIDDAHLRPEIFREGILADLVRTGPPNLTVVLTSRSPVNGVSREVAYGRARTLSQHDLALTQADVLDAASLLGTALDPDQSAALVESTGGWAAAVRLGLLASSSGRSRLAGIDRGEDALTEYVADEVLSLLPPELRHFIVSTTTCDWLSPELASHLTGEPAAGHLLETVVERGLFLDRMTGPRGRQEYRWHPVFARACRRVLSRTDPTEPARLHERAAIHLRDTEPFRAFHHALAAGQPALARDILVSLWVALLLDDNAATLQKACHELPHPWSEDPVVTAVLACCQDLDGDRAGGSITLDRAAANATADDALHLDAARLLVADDHEELTAACDRVLARIRAGDTSGPNTNALLFLVGWAELRLRRDPLGAVSLLRSAADSAAHAGQDLLARKARSNLAWALAFMGDFTAAQEALPGSGELAPGQDPWLAYDGGIETFTAGYLALWQGRLAEAAEQFTIVLAHGGNAPYAALARIHLAFVASASRDPRLVKRATTELATVSAAEQHGLPWGAYLQLARALLRQASGDIRGSAQLARPLAEMELVPVTTVEAARLLLAANDVTAAKRALERLTPLSRQPRYVQVSALVLHSVIAWRQGDPGEAHRSMEQALALAESTLTVRPFDSSLPGLRQLLVAHATHGTDHAEFLAARIAASDRRSAAADPAILRLTPRELEVLSYLRTTLSTADIAAALFVSVNTVKTHQRTLYRKLGVSGRREAVSSTLNWPTPHDPGP